ncbi:MAG: hypothetical protein NC236_00465 [Mycoplasma sp.]|nr:hypothetical protein [Mycoplasma sp.]
MRKKTKVQMNGLFGDKVYAEDLNQINKYAPMYFKGAGYVIENYWTMDMQNEQHNWKLNYAVENNGVYDIEVTVTTIYYVIPIVIDGNGAKPFEKSPQAYIGINSQLYFQVNANSGEIKSQAVDYYKADYFHLFGTKMDNNTFPVFFMTDRDKNLVNHYYKNYWEARPNFIRENGEKEYVQDYDIIKKNINIVFSLSK